MTSTVSIPSSASSSNFNMSVNGNASVSSPTLPPDWQWICCDQDHGSSSRAPSDTISAGVSGINGVADGGMNGNVRAEDGTNLNGMSSSPHLVQGQGQQQQQPQSQPQHIPRLTLLNQGRKKSGRGSFLNPLSISGSTSTRGSNTGEAGMNGPASAGASVRSADLSAGLSAGLGLGLGVGAVTGSKSPVVRQGRRDGHRSARSLDPGLGRLHPRNHPHPHPHPQPLSPAQHQLQYLQHQHQHHHQQYPQQLDHQHPNNTGQTGIWTPQGYVTPNMTGSSTDTKSGSARSNPSSRASTPGLSRGQTRAGSGFYPPAGADPNLTSVQDHMNLDPSGMTAPFSDAQLAQFMTYCCDKDDCVDPFPPPSAPTPALAEPEQGINNKHDESYMDHVMFQAMFPHSGPGGLTPNSTPIPCTLDPGECDALGMDPAYCCGGGPDCHEPIVDSIGCEGHPRQCGLPECCAGESQGQQGMDVFMKGVDWECLDASHGYVPRVTPSGSQTPLTLASNTHTTTTTTPHGAFSTQASPFLNPASGESQEFDLGPPAQDAGPSTDEQIQAFLAAVAKGNFLSGQPIIPDVGHIAQGDTLMDQVGSATNPGHSGAEGKAVETHVCQSHVCHWQNCHAHFENVQDLLSHVSSEHLKIAPSRTQEQIPAYQFGTASSTGLDSRSNSGSAVGGLESQLSNRDPGAFSSLQYGGGGFGQTSNYAEVPNTSGSKNDGLMACLWDDCMPGPDPAVGSRPFTGAFAQGLAGAPSIGPSGAQDFAKDLESLRLLSRNASVDMTTPGSIASGYSQNLGDVAQNNVNAQHLHRACHVPVPVQNDNPLDSASAVLKHLLEQHLGTEATNSLLNIAQSHYTSVSAMSTHDDGKNATAGTSGKNLVPPPRKSSRTDTPQSAPQRRGSDDKEEVTTFQCRWHGCSKVYSTNTALTEHISNVHVGRGKSKYECLWEGCVRCDNECDSCDEGDKMETDEGEKRGRKFATRQKVLRHIQSHTGYRPFVCHLCGQSVSEQATLNAHLRRHAEEKPFKCDEEACDKAFASAASLAVHKRAHSGTKTHICPHCDRGFIELSNLTKHIRTHTGDKPFSCPLNGCGRAFCRSDQLKRHMMTCRYRKASDDDRSSTTPP